MESLRQAASRELASDDRGIRRPGEGELRKGNAQKVPSKSLKSDLKVKLK